MPLSPLSKQEEFSVYRFEHNTTNYSVKYDSSTVKSGDYMSAGCVWHRGERELPRAHMLG